MAVGRVAKERWNGDWRVLCGRLKGLSEEPAEAGERAADKGPQVANGSDRYSSHTSSWGSLVWSMSTTFPSRQWTGLNAVD